MSKVKQQWKPEEIEKLTQLTQSNRDNQREIDWKLIASQMENRTELQCKSYYQNILKKKLTTTMRKNHNWNRIEYMMLYALFNSTNGDFEEIQKQMPNFTVQQLKSQWIQVNKWQNLFQSDFQRVIKDAMYIQTIPLKIFLQEEYSLRVGVARKYHIQKNPNIEKQYSQLYNTYWKNIDPQSIFDIYQQELIRRKIEKPIFNVTAPENEWIF
ncbi:Myb-like_DNA-binding domain-containing protein [Hexamita inflata]|uniref:Myb-like DNA-binding domain-containing protein n=1 Tax=Hexamita inflata TaxID=28002 RepID=A0AA86PIJ5_9EUKA|nr:Myb-like DNA-binding domain-containing protein [Hexamita inflata]